jgi:hypothetical protein
MSLQASGAVRRPEGRTGRAALTVGLRASVETGSARREALLRRGAAEAPAAAARSPVQRRELPGERGGATAAERRSLVPLRVGPAAVLRRQDGGPEPRAQRAAAVRGKAPILPERPAERVRQERAEEALRPSEPEPRAHAVPCSRVAREAELTAVAAEVARAVRLPDAVRPEAEGEVAPVALPEDAGARTRRAAVAGPPGPLAGGPTGRVAALPGSVRLLVAGLLVAGRRADPVEGEGSEPALARPAGPLAYLQALRRQAALPEPPPGEVAGHPEASRRPVRPLTARTQCRRMTPVFPVRAAARARPLSHRTG